MVQPAAVMQRLEQVERQLRDLLLDNLKMKAQIVDLKREAGSIKDSQGKLSRRAKLAHAEAKERMYHSGET